MSMLFGPSEKMHLKTWATRKPHPFSVFSFRLWVIPKKSHVDHPRRLKSYAREQNAFWRPQGRDGCTPKGGVAGPKGLGYLLTDHVKISKTWRIPFDDGPDGKKSPNIPTPTALPFHIR